MERKAVESSTIASLGYEASTRTLEVEFKSGGVWQYTGVPPDCADKLAHADSVGSFFSRNVRNVFPAKKVA